MNTITEYQYDGGGRVRFRQTKNHLILSYRTHRDNDNLLAPIQQRELVSISNWMKNNVERQLK